jgi:hypothetical protein
MMRFAGLCLDGTMFVSIMTMSCSLRPGHGMHLFSKEGRFVMKTYKVLVSRVGKSTICSPPKSNMVLMKIVLICAGFIWTVVLDDFRKY